MNEVKRKVRKLVLKAEYCLINNQLAEASGFNKNARELILQNWDEQEFHLLLSKVMRQKNEITLEMVKTLST